MPELINITRVRDNDTAYIEEMKLRCQTDLLFLARVLGYSKVRDDVHGPVAALCVQKNPALSIEEQSGIKERLHLDPRGTFKSTLSIVDSVQWGICFPDIRVCKLTATKPLANAIVGEITSHFVKPPLGDPTPFQTLFPDFCIAPRDRRVGEFTIPCRSREWREATVMAFSIESSISGWHFDVMDPDDPVDTVNSATPQGVEKVKTNYRINRKTLMPWGYVNFKGTRYNPFDLWGDILKKARPGKIKTLVRAALKTKNGRRLEEGRFPASGDVELLFPQLLSYDFLKDQFEDDYGSFMTQYMNDAHGDKEVTFTEELMLGAVLEAGECPIAGESVMAWRFSYDGKPCMKYAAGAAGTMHNGRLYVMDAVRGRFAPSTLAHRVVQMAKRNGVHQVRIEDSPGARYLESAIQNYALVANWPLQIQWLEFQEDDGARSLRMKGTEPLLASKRLLLSDALECLDDAHQQFTNFGAMEENELVDVIARLAETLPRSIAVDEPDPEQELAWELAKQRELYDQRYGLGRYAPREPLEEEKPYQPPTPANGLDDCLGGLNG